MRETGWLRRVDEKAVQSVAAWPDWMKRAAGIAPTGEGNVAKTTGWIGVDLDGTLAEYHGWNDGRIGKPVPAMVDKVRRALWRGEKVRIFTARVGSRAGYSDESGRSDDEGFIAEQRAAIQAWCKEHIGIALPVTAMKDFNMVELWDDRAKQVIKNTGRFLEEAQVMALEIRSVR